MSKVFVSSMSDTSKESAVVKDVISQLNRSPNKLLNYEFVDRGEFQTLENSSSPSSSITAFIKNADIFIGVLWTPHATTTGESYVQKELEIALEEFKKRGKIRIKLFLNNEPISLSLLSSVEEIERLEDVLKLKRKVEDLDEIPVSPYTGLNDFREQVQRYLTTLQHKEAIGAALPQYIYRFLFQELDLYVAQFEQLRRDYKREISGSEFIFAVDYSELYGYLRYDPSRPNLKDRGSINNYVFNNIQDRLTLMPGAVGELLTDVEKYLPPKRFLSKDYISAFESVNNFITEYPSRRGDEQATLELYRDVEQELREVWGHFFDVVVSGSGNAYYTPYEKLRELIKNNRIIPIEGVQGIDSFPAEVQKAAQIVRNNLNTARPMKPINNHVDVIDFSVTWLLNSNSQSKNTYYCLYTQSNTLIRACTMSADLTWSDDFLVRNANYLKFRTKLQDFTMKKRVSFVEFWDHFCRDLQRELKNLSELGGAEQIIQIDSLKFLDKFRRFDEECRQFLQLHDPSDEAAIDLGPHAEVNHHLENAVQLYEKLNNDPTFTASMDQAYEIVKGHLENLTKELHLFAPKKADPADVKMYKRNLEKWLDSDIQSNETDS